jgi:hypothetical protein
VLADTLLAVAVVVLLGTAVQILALQRLVQVARVLVVAEAQR